MKSLFDGLRASDLLEHGGAVDGARFLLGERAGEAGFCNEFERRDV
jgi:hypothetical protein